MNRFSYTVRDQHGQKVKGQVLALDRRSAAWELMEKGLYVIDLRKIPCFLQRKVSDRDLSFFCSQLSSMIRAGLPLTSALDIMASETKSPRLKEALIRVSSLVKEGSSFSEALANYPEIFPEVMIHMVRVGQKGGILGEILDKVGKYLERRSSLSQKIKRALTYPLFVLAFSFMTLILLITFILPTFGQVFRDLEVELPLITQLVIGFGEGVLNYWYLIAGLLFLIPLGIALGIKTKKGKRAVDRLKLGLPMVGKITQRVILSRTSHTLGILLQGGVPILSALEVAGQVAGNQIFKEAFIDLEDEVRHGERLGKAMHRSPLFPSLVRQMVMVGESSGCLDRMLLQVAAFYEHEAEHAVKTLASFIEPLSTMLVGMVVGVIVISMFLPLIRVASVLME